MAAQVVHFYCLREVLICSACHLPTLTLAVLSKCWYPRMTAGGSGTHSSHKGETGGDCLFPVRRCLHARPFRSGSASWLTSWGQGKTEAFPTVEISQWLWSHRKEGRVLALGGGDRCKLASGAQLSCSRDNEEGFKAFLKFSPWGNLNVSVVHLCLHIQTSATCTKSWELIVYSYLCRLARLLSEFEK